MLLVLVSSFRNSESYQQISVKTTYQTTPFQIRYLLCWLNIQIQFDCIISTTLHCLSSKKLPSCFWKLLPVKFKSNRTSFPQNTSERLSVLLLQNSPRVFHLSDITQPNKSPKEQLTDHFQRRFPAHSKITDARRMRSFGTIFMVVGTVHPRKWQSCCLSTLPRPDTSSKSLSQIETNLHADFTPIKLQ